MGDKTFTEYDFETATAAKSIVFERSSDGSRRATSTVTHKAEQVSKSTGKLHRSVDPAVMVIRRSLPRFEAMPDGRFRMTVGCPMDIESSCDTTGSMGKNVQTMIEVLPNTYDMIKKVLPDYDIQLALGIFGDVCDTFVINRPQFEMTAEKIVDYVTNLVPERAGGDDPEDPQYAIFGAAYLTNTYTNRIGLKGYHFMITDAPMHDRLDPDVIERIYGENVWNELANNGFPEITRYNLPDYPELFDALKNRAHAFYIAIGDSKHCYRSLYDEYHTITIWSTRCLPAIEAAIIGLTEGTLQPMDVRTFLENNQVDEDNIESAMRGLLKVPYRAQRALEENAGIVIPKKGDIFATKTDLQPVEFASDVPEEPEQKDNGSKDESTWI